MSKKQGKITVKHYLNKRAKVKMIGREKFFPLYLQIIVAGHKAQIKSKIQDFIGEYIPLIEKNFGNRELTGLLEMGYFSQTFLDRVFYENDYPVANLLHNEIDILRKMILENDPFDNSEFSLINFSQQYTVCVTDIDTLLNRNITVKYREQLRELNDESQPSEVKKLSSFLMDFVRWDLPFVDFHRAVLEIIPDKMEFLERNFPEALQNQLSAFLSWSHASGLIRKRMAKLEKGLFPGINYYDWKEECKALLHEFLEPQLGKEMTREYISLIDRSIHEEFDKERRIK